MDLGAPGSDLLGVNEAAALRVLARQGRPVSGRDVARLAGASASSARRALLRLVRIGLVRSYASSHAQLYELCRNHVLWPPVEQILTAATTVRAAVAALAASWGEQEVTAALFGSLARGEADADSDVDLALVWPEDLPASRRDVLVDEVTQLVESLTGNPAQVFAVTRADLGRMVATGDPLVATWEADSLTLSGPDLNVLLRHLRQLPRPDGADGADGAARPPVEVSAS